MEPKNLQFDEPRVVTEAAASEVRERAFLHDDPDAYRAGVRDALKAVASQLRNAADRTVRRG